MSDKVRCHFGFGVSWLGIKSARFLSFHNLSSSTSLLTYRLIGTLPIYVFFLYLLISSSCTLLYLLVSPLYISFDLHSLVKIYIVNIAFMNR